MAIRVLFLGESWLGSCARSFREALARQPSVLVEEVNLDAIVPRWNDRRLRAFARIAAPLLAREVEREVLAKADQFKPDLVVVYKGTPVTPRLVRALRDGGPRTVNVYPDASPLTQTANVRRALGTYDLVVSTKPWHPSTWSSLGFTNRCRFVAQGYDPLLHLVTDPVVSAPYEVGMVATYRTEYGRLLEELATTDLRSRRMVIYGNGWNVIRSRLPDGWSLLGPRIGRAYVEALRSMRVVIAPVTREISFEGRAYPGDEDSTRTYELPACSACFVHLRTRFVQTLFAEEEEALFYDGPTDLANKVIALLSNDEQRAKLARAAHKRAVPAYSTDTRAREFLEVASTEFDLCLR